METQVPYPLRFFPLLLGAVLPLALMGCLASSETDTSELEGDLPTLTGPGETPAEPDAIAPNPSEPVSADAPATNVTPGGSSPDPDPDPTEPPAPSPPVGDECNSTSQCQGIYGSTADDCFNSQSAESVCHCGGTPCWELVEPDSPPPAPTPSDLTFLEADGIVVIEMESEPLAGDWAFRTQIDGYTGDGYYHMAGNSPAGAGSSPNGPIIFTFQIQNAGTYQLMLRAAKNDSGTGRSDYGNDCYVRATGQGDARDTFIKLYGGNSDRWGWAQHLDHADFDHVRAEYEFDEGTHTLEIAGRSQGFNVDRIVLQNVALASESDARAASESGPVP